MTFQSLLLSDEYFLFLSTLPPLLAYALSSFLLPISPKVHLSAKCLVQRNSLHRVMKALMSLLLFHSLVILIKAQILLRNSLLLALLVHSLPDSGTNQEVLLLTFHYLHLVQHPSCHWQFLILLLKSTLVELVLHLLLLLDFLLLVALWLFRLSLNFLESPPGQGAPQQLLIQSSSWKRLLHR